MELSLFKNLLTLNTSEYDYLEHDDSLSPAQKQFKEMFRYFSNFHKQNNTSKEDIEYIKHKKSTSLDYITIHGREYPSPQNLELKPLCPIAKQYLTKQFDKQNYTYSFHGSSDYSTGKNFEQLHIQFSHPYTIIKHPSGLDMVKHIKTSQIQNTYTDVKSLLYPKWTHSAHSRHFRAFLAPNVHLIIKTDGFVNMTVKEI